MINNKNKYFDIVSNKADIDLKIKWNVQSFVVDGNDTGFIVQHITVKSSISSVQNNDYWECWHIKNGILENCTNDFDDNWSPIYPPFIPLCEDEIKASPDGLVRYFAQVFWFPSATSKYHLVKQWEPIKNSTSPAGDLPMTYHFNCDVDKYFVCNRFYEWNYKEVLSNMKGGERNCDT